MITTGSCGMFNCPIPHGAARHLGGKRRLSDIKAKSVVRQQYTACTSTGPSPLLDHAKSASPQARNSGSPRGLS